MASSMSPVASEATMSAPSTPIEPRPWLAAATLCRREWVRFIRQRNRVFGAIGQPVLFWILFGAGLGPTFHVPGAQAGQLGYREYFFPGTLVLILLFTAIFTTISIIEDRREGFLQSVLVAPIPRWSMVLGKLLGGTLIALAQGLLFLALAPTLGLRFGMLSAASIIVYLFVLAFALTALGFVLAWRLDSTQGFHAVMSVLLLPMWLLSGAFFPAESGVLGWIVRLNPLTYGVAGVRRMLYWEAPAGLPPLDLPPLAVCWGVTLAFAALTFAAAWKVSAGRVTGDLL
jgi:ABC-2 type transport system permease protein